MTLANALKGVAKWLAIIVGAFVAVIVVVAVVGNTKSGVDRSQEKPTTGQSSTSQRQTPAAPQTDTPAETQLATRRSKWQSGIGYRFFQDGSCATSPSEGCMSAAQYQDGCAQVEGISEKAIRVLAMSLDEPQRTLALNLGVSFSSVKWARAVNGTEGCFVSLAFSGMVAGTSISTNENFRVSGFLQSNQSDKLLISYIANY